jgi:hypothetical protein
MYVYNKPATDINKVLLVIVGLLVGFTAGAVYTSGSSGPISSTTTESVNFTPPYSYSGTDADLIYHTITGQHFSEIGNIYDRCTRQVFNVRSLSVNMFSYKLQINGNTGDTALIYVLKINPINATQYTILYQEKRIGNITGSISMTSAYDIAVVVFYQGLRLIIIEGFFYHS